jgi:plastocyanin
MMRAALVCALVALVAALVPVGASAAGHHKRQRLRTVVAKKVHRHAPRWKARRPLFGTPVPAAGAASSASTATSPVATGPAATPTPVATPKPPTLPGADPHRVSVTSREYSFTLSQGTVSAGTVHVQFDNSRAEDPHQLGVRVKGGATVHESGLIDPGDVVTEDVSLSPGTYVLFCPLGTHESLGMKAEVTVTG